MCGLAGFVRQPGGSNIQFASRVVEELLLKLDHRGKDATGFATMNSHGQTTIFKKAVEIKSIVASDPWRDAIEALDDDITSVIGHVRHSTHKGNANKDSAAHPFREGKVVGAHNGVIYNWEEIGKQLQMGKDWEVDSQAAFGALSRIKRPEVALSKLEGWFGLTWFKKNRLFMVKSHGVPLAFAYLAEYRLGFWCSEAKVLRETLKSLDPKIQFTIFELQEDRIYELDSKKFDDKGVHSIRTDVLLPQTRIKTRTTRQQELWEATQGSGWSSTTPVTSMGDVWTRLEALEKRVGVLEREKRFLQDVVSDLLFRSDGEAYLGDLADGSFELEGDVQADGASPYHTAICESCHVSGGKVIDLPNGKVIHEDCIFADADRTSIPAKTPQRMALVRSNVNGEWVTEETRDVQDAATNRLAQIH